MKNVDVIENFINGRTNGKTKNLRIEGDKLFNYDTCLAERVNNKNMIVNLTKYSSSTSTIQNKLFDALQFRYDGYFEIKNNISMGADSLID